MSLFFKFAKCDGTEVTKSFSVVPITFPKVYNDYIVTGDPVTGVSASITLDLIPNVYKVENNLKATNDWFIAVTTSSLSASQCIVSGSIYSGSICSTTFNFADHVLNPLGVKSVVIKPSNENVGWEDTLVLEDGITFDTDATSSLTVNLIPQPYDITFKGEKKHTKFNILPSGSSCFARDVIVTSTNISSVITPQNQSDFGYTAAVSDARYEFKGQGGGSSESASWASSSLSSSHALTASHVLGTADTLVVKNYVDVPLVATDTVSFSGGTGDLVLRAEEDIRYVSIDVGGLQVKSNNGLPAFRVSGVDGTPDVMSGKIWFADPNYMLGGGTGFTFKAEEMTNPIHIGVSPIGDAVSGNLYGTASNAETASNAVNALTASKVDHILQTTEGGTGATYIPGGYIPVGNGADPVSFPANFTFIDGQLNVPQINTTGITGSLNGTASWSSNWDSSSVVTLIGTKQNQLVTASTIPITASVAVKSTNAETASVADVAKSYDSNTLTLNNNNDPDYGGTLVINHGTNYGSDVSLGSEFGNLTILNAGNIIVDGNVNPLSTNTFDLGESGNKWNVVYANSFVGGLTGSVKGTADTASFWNSSSLVTLIGTKQNQITTGSTLPITSSIAEKTIGSVTGSLSGSNVTTSAITSSAINFASVIYQNGSRIVHTTGTNNTFVGVNAGNFTLTGVQNTTLGIGALAGLTSGNFNFGIGSYAGSGITTGNSNIVIGNAAGTGISTQTGNTVVGDAAGYTATLTNTVVIGRGATRGSLTLTDGVFLGWNAGGTVDGGKQTVSGLSNVICIGKNSSVAASNTMVLGGTGSDAVKVCIGQPSGSATLNVNGNISGSAITSSTLVVSPYERHVQIPAMLSGNPSNQPTQVDYFTAGGLQFASTGTKYAYLQWEIPDDWDGTNIYMEIDWFPDSGAMTGTDTLKWDVEYRSIAEGELMNNGTSVTTSSIDSGDYSQYQTKHARHTLVYNNANQPLTAQDHIYFKVSRDTTVTNDFGGTVTVPAFEIIYNSKGLPTS